MSSPHGAVAPRHLSAEAKSWWAKFLEGWTIDDAGCLNLQTALEAFDRMRQAQAIPKREGLTLKGRAHPCTAVERDSRLAMLRALRRRRDCTMARARRGDPEMV